MPDAVMLFAAGFGTRMGALTRDLPKPLVPLGGRPMIDHALDLAREAGLARIVANAHYRADQIEAHLAPRGVAISREAPDILDTGGGLRAALPLLGAGPVFTMNTDALWLGTNPFEELARAWDPARMDALLLCVPPEATIGHAGQGDFTTDAQGRAQRGPGLVFGGAQILRTEALADMPAGAFSLNRLWDRMLAEGRLFCHRYTGRWADLGHPEGLRLAEETLAEAGRV